MKLIKKEQRGSKIYKIHDKPQTPYERVLASNYIPEENKLKLKKMYEAQNPFELKKQMRRLEKTVSTLAKISYDDWMTCTNHYLI
jgi:hypothetical protein